MRPLLSRLTPPRPLRALQQPTTTTARTPTRRNICTTVTQRFWGVSTPADPTPPVEEAEVGPRPDPVQEQGYVPRHDGRGLRVVGIVGKLGKRVQVVNVERYTNPPSPPLPYLPLPPSPNLTQPTPTQHNTLGEYTDG